MPALAVSARDRLIGAITHSAGCAPDTDAAAQSVLLAEPDAIRAAVQACVGPDHAVVVTGTLDRRLVLIEHDDGQTWTAADLSGQPHNSRQWPQWTQGRISLTEPDQWLSTASLTPEGRYRLTRPRLLLASLYHPEHFPLPRFPLYLLVEDGELVDCVPAGQFASGRINLPGFTDTQEEQVGGLVGTLGSDGLSATDQREIQNLVDELAAAVPPEARLYHDEVVSGSDRVWLGIGMTAIGILGVVGGFWMGKTWAQQHRPVDRQGRTER